ncbi:YopX family protein [Fusobacterium sp. CM22]|uniref:YopX family protein n=1 Tax=Fusobacterium sp. CM22 TaxID=936563 RepID=UPI00044F2B13|nr:YopX family protein [Fusobacterium sp. CM22]EUB15662.1 TIGR01671 family protein [Fusobacterium sp. CM22]
MKEFKMKAWLKKEKKMVAIIGIDFNYEYIRYTEDDNLFNSDYKTAEFKDIELLQFSGVKDKAGQELYEADVIKFNDGIDDIYGLISYDDEDGAYRVSYENITEHLLEREGDFEIVGNIFENPDLHEQLGY